MAEPRGRRRGGPGAIRRRGVWAALGTVAAALLLPRPAAAYNVTGLCDIIRSGNVFSNALTCQSLNASFATLAATPTDACANASQTGYGAQEEPLRVAASDLPKPFAGLDAPRPFTVRAKTVFTGAARTKLLRREGATYNWLWQAIRNIKHWWSCSKAFGGSLDGYLVPQGWEPVGGTPEAPGGPPIEPGIYNLLEPDNVSYPLMAVLRRNATRQMVILLRGSNTMQEWGMDLMYAQVSGEPFPGPSFPGNTFHGATHKGFTVMFQGLWLELRGALEAAVVGVRAAARPTSITVAGHSLGGSVGMLVAYATKRFLISQQLGKIKVGAVSFGSALVGSSAFSASIKKLVNTRQIMFEYDLFPLFPCPSPRKPAKGESPAQAMPACDDVVVPSPNPSGLTYWRDYARVPGAVSLSPSDLPAAVTAVPSEAAAWDRLNFIAQDSAQRFRAVTSAAHVCSYRCTLRRYSQRPAGDNDFCLLTRQPLAGSGPCPFPVV